MENAAHIEDDTKEDQMKKMKTGKLPTGKLVRLACVGAVLMICGCISVGPDYVRPDGATPATWHAGLEEGITDRQSDEEETAKWWTALGDPMLSDLVGRAVEGNLDIKEAQARLRESRARLGISRSGLFPSLDATGLATKSRGSEETGGGQEREFYSVGFDAAWELDLFGGVSRSVEAAQADLQAEEEGLRDVLVSLTAEVALNYAELRTAQARLAAVEKNLQVQEESYRLVRTRVAAGLDDELTELQARYNLENARSQLPGLRASINEAMNRLSILLGETPGSLQGLLREQMPVPAAPLEIVVCVPADLLRRRPDIGRAERELAAQTARIGVATAELYPKLTLNGSIGLEALSPDKLLRTTSHAYTIGPRVTWPIFSAGSIRRNIDVQSALQEQALIQYESTILNALEEVENALVSYAEEERRRESLQEAAQAAREAMDLARTNYIAGLSDYDDVLDAQRMLLSLEEQLAQSSGTALTYLIQLYKALGGGWERPGTNAVTINDRSEETL